MSTQPHPTLEPNQRPTTTARTTPSTSESWVDQCQAQFDTQHTDPLKNLVDERNAARLEAAYRADDPTASH